MEKSKQMKNMIASGTFVVFSLILIFVGIPRQISVNAILGTSNTAVDSRFFPYITTAFIGILAAIEFVISFIKYIRIEGEERKEPKNLARVFTVFALFVLYALLFQYMGFVLSTIIVPPFVLYVMGGRKWYHFASFYGVAAITYILFVFVLKISL